VQNSEYFADCSAILTQFYIRQRAGSNIQGGPKK